MITHFWNLTNYSKGGSFSKPCENREDSFQCFTSCWMSDVREILWMFQLWKSSIRACIILYARELTMRHNSIENHSFGPATPRVTCQCCDEFLFLVKKGLGCRMLHPVKGKFEMRWSVSVEEFWEFYSRTNINID